MSIKSEPKITLPRWGGKGRIILGWKFGQGYYCLDCARLKGMGDGDGLDGYDEFSAVVQDDPTEPLICKIRPCSEGCGADLAELFSN